MAPRAMAERVRGLDRGGREAEAKLRGGLGIGRLKWSDRPADSATLGLAGL
jgi:hypothetical protein